MNTVSELPSIIVVESGQALPLLLYNWLEDLGLDILGPTDDLFDAYRLARDRQPRLAIVDMRIDPDCRQHLHATLRSLNVPCFELTATTCRQLAGLLPLRNAIGVCGFARKSALSERDLGALPSVVRMAR